MRPVSRECRNEPAESKDDRIQSCKTHLDESFSEFGFAFRTHVEDEDPPRLLHEWYDTRKDHDGDKDGRERVKAVPAVAVDQQRGDDDADGSERVGEDVLLAWKGELHAVRKSRTEKRTRKTPFML